MCFYFERNDNSFCSKEGDLVLLEQQVFLQNLFSVQKTISFILFPLPKKKKKLKRRRLKKRKKDRKRDEKEAEFPSIFSS